MTRPQVFMGDLFPAPVVPPGITVPLVFVDTETTHLDRLKREIWDIGVIRREPDGRRQGWSAIVEDVDLAYASEVSLDIGGFQRRHPLGRDFVAATDGTVYVTQWEAALRLAALLEGAHWVGAVPDFDEHSIWTLLRRHGFIDRDNGDVYPWHYHLIDVENLAAGQQMLQPPWDFDYLCGLYGLSFEETGLARHTAIGDAAMNELLYDAVMLGGNRP